MQAIVALGRGQQARSGPSRQALRWGRAAIASSLLVVTAVAAACGGGSGSKGVASIGPTTSATGGTMPVGGSSPAANYANGLRYANCMRAEGEPGFPDPTNPGGFPTAVIESLNPTSHQFSAANAHCKRVLPNEGQPTPAELQQVIETGLKLARCMRAHGQPNFPDPGLSRGQITINFNNLDPNSPQYEKAWQNCTRTADS